MGNCKSKNETDIEIDKEILEVKRDLQKTKAACTERITKNKDIIALCREMQEIIIRDRELNNASEEVV